MTRAGVLDPARTYPVPRPLGATRSRLILPCGGKETSFQWRIDPWPGRDPAFPLGHDGAPGIRTRRSWPEAESRALLARDLLEVKGGHRIALGAAADPWPPEEAVRGRTRSVLEALARHEGLDLSIATRSDLVVAELDRLVDLATRHRIEVNVLIATLDRRLAEALEPGTPRPDLRLRAVSELVAAGIPTGVLLSPVIPWITDAPEALDGVAAAVAGAGGRWIRALARVPLPGALAAMFPEVQRELPDLVDRYRAGRARCPTLPDRYAAGLARFVERLRRRHGLVGGELRRDVPPPIEGPQLSLL